jgi:hypothetical protein
LFTEYESWAVALCEQMREEGVSVQPEEALAALYVTRKLDDTPDLARAARRTGRRSAPLFLMENPFGHPAR